MNERLEQQEYRTFKQVFREADDAKEFDTIVWAAKKKAGDQLTTKDPFQLIERRLVTLTDNVDDILHYGLPKKFAGASVYVDAVGMVALHPGQPELYEFTYRTLDRWYIPACITDMPMDEEEEW